MSCMSCVRGPVACSLDCNVSNGFQNYTFKTISMKRDADCGGESRKRDAVADTVTSMLTERGQRYGTFAGQAEISQSLTRIMNSYLEQRGKHLEDDQCESLRMIAHKIARIINGDPNYADSWLDIAGYARLVADRLNGEAR